MTESCFALLITIRVAFRISTKASSQSERLSLSTLCVFLVLKLIHRQVMPFGLNTLTHLTQRTNAIENVAFRFTRARRCVFRRRWLRVVRGTQRCLVGVAADRYKCAVRGENGC